MDPWILIGGREILGGCGGPPPGNFEMSDALRLILKHFWVLVLYCGTSNCNLLFWLYHTF